jgi:predicted Rossmann fold nucleotide-binding protein DprA/Smf involved in DNA uptake
MKVAIVGGRDFCDYNLFNKVIEKLFEKDIFKEVTEIISGGAKGTDSLAEKYGNECNIKTKIFLPD